MSENNKRDSLISIIKSLIRELGIRPEELFDPPPGSVTARGFDKEGPQSLTPAGKEVAELFDRVPPSVVEAALNILRATSKKRR